MRFDEFPDAIPDEVSKRAAAAAAVLDDGRPEALHDYGRRLAAGVSGESGLSETLVAIEGLICQFMLGHGEARERHKAALTPWIEMGGQMIPPPVSVFPKAASEYVRIRASSARRADVRARLHDFLWERWALVTGARGAVDAYIETADALDMSLPMEVHAVTEYLIRAAELALRTEYRQPDVRSRVSLFARQATAGDHPAWVLEHTADLLTRDEPLAHDLIDVAVRAASDASARGDRPAERSYLESALALARAIALHPRAEAIRRSIAASHEGEATERAAEGGLMESFLLTEALRRFMDLGDSEAVRQIRDRLARANERALGEMHEISGQISIPREEIERALSTLSVVNSSEPAAIRILPWELGFWPPWAQVQEDRRSQGSVLSSLASATVMEHDARSVPLPAAGPEREAAETIRQFVQRTTIDCGLAEIALRSLRERGRWSADAVTAAIADADATLGRVCEPGVAAYEIGDRWTALHVLTPQVERGVRLVGTLVNAPIHRVTTSQRLLWSPLDPMLQDPVIRATLGDDLARELEALFTNEYGPSIRHNVAHGATDVDAAEVPATVSLMTILAIAEIVARLRQGGSVGPRQRKAETRVQR